jgi:hypothetical protein
MMLTLKKALRAFHIAATQAAGDQANVDIDRG